MFCSWFGTSASEKKEVLEKMTLRVGNDVQPTSTELFEWNVYVQAPSPAVASCIEKVVYRLHPTFNPREYIATCGHDGLTFRSGTFTGWGTFKVGVFVHFQGGEVQELSHQLVFAEGGSHHDIELKVPSSLAATLLPSPRRETAAAPSSSMLIDDTPSPTAIGLAAAGGSVCSAQILREDLQVQLANNPAIEHTDPAFFHGRAYNGPADEPMRTWECSRKPRTDHGSDAAWLTATEFQDHEHVMDAKCTLLAQLIEMSNKTVVYSGAGISVAACIGQAAAGSGGKGSKGLDALPTKTHFALGHLAKHGYIHGWVQQNHDGLPQKAGFPQENINEIHGSWYDPSNPVVLYSGSLQHDKYPWMREDAESADLVIVVGTSLGGLNADQVATKTAARSTKNAPWQYAKGGGALGTVIINLQQTEQDGKSTLRMFGTTDSVLPRVLERLGIGEAEVCKCGSRFCRETNGYMYPGGKREEHSWRLLLRGDDDRMHPTQPAAFPEEPVVVVPYDREGNRSETARMRLDLRDGARVKITDGHNIQGAGQPAYLHIGADEPYQRPQPYGGQLMKNGPGHGKVVRRLKDHGAYQLNIEGAYMELGVWWLDVAKRGKIEKLPVVNLDPVMESE